MTEKIRIELDDATDAGTDAAIKNLEKLEDAAKSLTKTVEKVEDAFDELVDAEVAAAKQTQQTTQQTRGLGQALAGHANAAKEAARANQEFKQRANETGETLDKLKSAADGNVTSLIKLLGQFKAIAVPVAAAVAAWKGLEVVLANTGKSADGAENNLTKLHKTLSNLSTVVGETAKQMLGGEQQLSNFDETVTGLTDSVGTLVEKFKELATGVSTEMTAASEKIAASQAKQKQGALEIAKVNEEMKKSAAEKAAAEHLASIGTQQELAREKEKLVEKLRQMTINGKVGTEEFAKELANLRAISQRQIQLKEETIRDYAEREKAHQAHIDAKHALEREQRKAKKEADDKALNEEAEAIRKAIDKENEARIKAAEVERQAREKAKADAIRIEQEKQNALKGMLEEKGVSGKQILQQQDPRQVVKILQDKAAEEAEQKFNRENKPGAITAASRERLNRMIRENEARRKRAEETGEQQDTPVLSIEQIIAKAKEEEVRLRDRRKEAAIKSARTEAFRDFRTGTTNSQELAQAQGQAAQQQISAMQASGQLSGQTVAAVRSLVNAAQQNQMTTEALQQQVQQLQQQANLLNQNAGAVRQRAQRGGVGK